MFRSVPGSFRPILRTSARPIRTTGFRYKSWSNKLEREFKIEREFMLGRICFLLLIVVAATPLSAYAQQDPASNTKTPKTQPGNTSQPGNINHPVSTENWGSPSDIK